MYIYTGFCILSIFLKHQEEHIGVHVHWVLYSQNKNIDIYVYWVLYYQYSLETERRKQSCACVLDYVFAVFPGNRKKNNMYMYIGFCILNIVLKQKEENIVVHVYWVLYSQYPVETETR